MYRITAETSFTSRETELVDSMLYGAYSFCALFLLAGSLLVNHGRSDRSTLFGITSSMITDLNLATSKGLPLKVSSCCGGTRQEQFSLHVGQPFGVHGHIIPYTAHTPIQRLP